MRRNVLMVAAGLTSVVVALYVIDRSRLSAQSAPTRVAAVPAEKGGQDIFGAYEVVPGWPKKLSTNAGHEGWTFGAGQSVFAESADRIYVVQRGELPEIPRPQTKKLSDLGPSIAFPIGRLPWRDATTASPPGNGGSGQLAEGGMDAWVRQQQDGRRRALGALRPRVRRPGQPAAGDGQLDAVGREPAAPALHRDQPVRRGQKRLAHRRPQARHLQVHARRQDEAADDRHLRRAGRRRDALQSSDLHGLVPRRQLRRRPTATTGRAWRSSTRTASSWRRGARRARTRTTRGPRFFNNVHGIAVDPKTRRVFVNDRGNHRAQVFDENGKFLDSWRFGDPPSDVHMFNITSDGYLWAADRGTNRILKYDLSGNFQYSWGTWGDFPGGMWGVHGMSTDPDGNFYVAEVDNGGAQKYRPRAGANPAFLVGKPVRSAWK